MQRRTVVAITAPLTMSSITDTIQLLINNSEDNQRELRWFIKAMPAVCSTEVMGARDPTDPEHIRLRTVRQEVKSPVWGSLAHT